MMTKKQLVSALSAVDDDTEISVVFRTSYRSRYDATINSLNVYFTSEGIKTELFVEETKDEQSREAA